MQVVSLPGAVAVGVGHLLAELIHNLAQRIGDAQVDNGHDGQRLQSQIGHALDHQVGSHNITQEEGGGQGGLLQHHDELIAESRKNVPHSLGQDDLHHSLALAEAQRPGGLGLSLVHGLDAGTDDLRHIGGGVDTQGDGHPHELAQLQEGEDIGQYKVEYIQLQQNRCAADDLDIHGGNEPDNSQLGHLHHGDQCAKDRAKRYGDDGQNQGVFQAGKQEELPIFAPDVCQIGEKEAKIHVLQIPFAYLDNFFCSSFQSSRLFPLR